MTAYVIPIILLIVFILSFFKSKHVYDDFVKGVKQALPLVSSIFPYLAATFIMTEVFEASGLSTVIIDLSANFFKIFGIDKALVPLILLKPFSGSGSLGLLSEIMTDYGVDSYLSKCASVIYGSSETIFYVGAVYYSKCKRKAPVLPFAISLTSNFISTVFACFICRVL